MDPHEVLTRIFADLKSDPDQRYEFGWKWFRPPDGINLSGEMVFITLVCGLGFSYVMKPFEKTLWSISVIFKGLSLRIEDAKFGLKFAGPDGAISDTVVTELSRLLERGFRVAERFVQPFLTDQINKGFVTVHNRFTTLDDRYRFLREQAEVSFSNSDTTSITATDLQTRVAEYNYRIRREREGFFLGIAAVDAYFSRLEHFLVLALPFCDFDPQNDNLVSFLTENWSDKFKRVVPLNNDITAHKLYQRLRVVKQRYRNKFAHGWFEKGASSLYVHFPPIGAIPAELSSRENVVLQFRPLTAPTFAGICELLDEVDSYFSNGRLRLAVKYAEAGLDVAFDPKSIAKYKSALNDEDSEGFIEAEAYFQDQFTNMDW